MRVNSPTQFAIIRILTGGWLFATFLNASLSHPLQVIYGRAVEFDGYIKVFHMLQLIESEAAMRFLLAFLAVLSLFLILGWWRQLVSFFVWFAWISLFLTHADSRHVSTFLGEWLLFACVLMPAGEPQILPWIKAKQKWRPQALIMWGSWYLVVLVVFFTILNTRVFLFNHASDWMLVSMALVAALGSWPPWRRYAWLLMLAFFPLVSFSTEIALAPVPFLLCLGLAFDRRWFCPREPRSSVVYFDGVCGLCNQFVDFLILEDDEEVFKFTPLQGEHAAHNLDSRATQSMESVVLQEGQVTWVRSDAACQIMIRLGGVWAVMHLALWIPRSVRDRAYHFVAKNRYVVFGKKDSCRIPTKEEMARFIP